MFRIVVMPDGERVLLEGKVCPDAWDVRIWEANGHREISARPKLIWSEAGTLSPIAMQMMDEAGSHLTEAERQAEAEQAAAERAERNLKRAAGRAKTQCRRIIKTEAFNELLTLTYRENQTDVELFKKHFAEWHRRMKRALGEFRYCAGFEPQERGAWHAHVACHKLPRTVLYQGVRIDAWKLGTAVWRSIVGADNGLCFVGGKTRHGLPRRSRMSIAQMAAYVSKYIIKHYELMPGEANRYSHSKGTKVGKPYTVTVTGLDPACAFEDVVELSFRLDRGHRVVSHRATRDDWSGGRYWLVTEPDRMRAVYE